MERRVALPQQNFQLTLLSKLPPTLFCLVFQEFAYQATPQAMVVAIVTHQPI